MFSGDKSAFLKIKIVIENSVLALIEVSPLILFPLIWSTFVILILLLMKSRTERFFSELLFFSLAGSTAAYLNKLTDGSVLENFVPSFVIAITFLFQLAGLSSKAMRKPIATRRVFLAGSGVAVGFILASRYLALTT